MDESNTTDLIPMPLQPMTDRITENHLNVFHDAPGPGGSPHRYIARDADTGGILMDLRFQRGPLGEEELNGVSTGTVIQ